MRFIKFLFSAGALAGLLYLLNTGLTIKGNTLPPLGAFFNPFSGFWQNAESLAGTGLVTAALGDQIQKITPPTASISRIAGLKGKVSVSVDDLAIPHIFAENLEDALTVQGYLTAKDRLFQMDISSRKALGRLSELVGARTIEVDRKSIHNGLPLGVERAMAATKRSPESMRMLEAYVRGVNAYVSGLTPAKYPVEYKLMNAAPELWTPERTLAVIEGMAESLVLRCDDVENARNMDVLGAETYNLLFPRYNPDQTPIIKDHDQWKGIKPDLSASKSGSEDKRTGAIFPVGSNKIPAEWDSHTHPERHEVRSGSNNWAVSGTNTASGKPLLANDPHLQLTLPSIWYQVQIHTPEQNTYGVSLPGVPGIVIGFNEHIAWGVTNVSHDVGDFYRVKWLDEAKTKYQSTSGPQAAEVRMVEIKVKGQASVLDTLRITHLGPILSVDPASPQCDLAFQWLPQAEPSPDLVMEFLNLNKAKNYAEYRNAIKPFDTPAQNFIFASTTGDIGITVQGKLPLRSAAAAEFVQDAATSNGWSGFIPEDHIPFEKNAQRGFVYSANQHSTPPSYPYPYYGYFDDYRGRRVHQRLEAMSKATLDSMAAMQLDNHLLLVDDALPTMISMLDTSGLDAAKMLIVNELRTWDGNYDRATKMGVFFELWHANFYEATFDDFKAREEKGEKVVAPDNWVLYKLLKSNPKHAQFDIAATPEKETAQQLINTSFDAAIIEYIAAQATGKANWGDFKQTEVVHIARIPGFAKKVTTDGHPNAPNANKGGHGPSWRMLVDLQDSVRAQAVYPGGQSGNPGSAHYDDMLQHWADGKYFESLFLKSADAPHARIRSTIQFTN
jgi:penicillin G amidase